MATTYRLVYHGNPVRRSGEAIGALVQHPLGSDGACIEALGPEVLWFDTDRVTPEARAASEVAVEVFDRARGERWTRACFDDLPAGVSPEVSLGIALPLPVGGDLGRMMGRRTTTGRERDAERAVLHAVRPCEAIVSVRRYTPDATDMIARHARKLGRSAYLIVADYGTVGWVEAQRIHVEGCTVRVTSSAYFGLTGSTGAARLRTETVEVWTRPRDAGGTQA